MDMIQWKNKPEHAKVQEDEIEMIAGKDTNLFNSPSGTFSCADFPFAYKVMEGDFYVKCKVTPNFTSLYDLGSIVVWENDNCWIKFAYENSDAGYPAIISIVTNIYSDDCNGPQVEGDVWLQIFRKNNTFALHYSQDGECWNLARIFNLSMAEEVCVGVSAQCPMGKECKVVFLNFEVGKEVPENIRNVNEQKESNQ